MFGIKRTSNSAGDRCLTMGTPMRRRRAGQAGDQLVNVMLVIVIAAAVGLIGTDVSDEINDSVDTSSNDFRNAQENLSQGYGDAMGLTDIVFIVLMFGVILSVLLAFRVR